MFVYLDESGDSGFKFDRGSSRYFVLTLLLVDDPIPLQLAIDELRTSLGFVTGNEFKFYHSSHEVRLSFLRMLRRQSFSARALVIDKTLITRRHMRQRETFYSYLVRMILEHDNDTIRDALLILDESVKSKKSKQHLSTYLRRELNTDRNAPKIRGVRYHDSQTDNLVQAADMICGAIYARYYRENDAYLREIRVKVGDLWEWRPYQAQ
jgi:hypothetical protein